MTRNHQPHFWEVNKASAFIDAMNASHSRPRHRAHHSWTQTEQLTPSKANSGRSRHLNVTLVGLAVFGGLVAANWIA